eukprot:Ihof_evm3s437 gene=Ihof_evmTU3s437
MSSFTWPTIYNFPPFFTLQPTEATRAKQIAAWCQLVRDYYKAMNMFELSLDQAKDSELFNNIPLGRQASDDLITAILKELVQKGNAEPMPSGRYIIYWRCLDDWAKIIYDYIIRTSQVDQVLTVYELHMGDYTEGE